MKPAREFHLTKTANVPPSYEVRDEGDCFYGMIRHNGPDGTWYSRRAYPDQATEYFPTIRQAIVHVIGDVPCPEPP